MEIKYLGHSSFLIKTKTAKVVTDPYDPEVVGMRFPKTEADIITISHHHHDHDNASVVAKPQTGEQLMIDLPGEFERLGVRIFGYLSYHDKTKGSERGEDILYKIEAEGVTLLHCGDLGYVPEDSFLDSLGDIDILFVPTGGFYTIDESEAAELVKKIEPAIIIPMHYNHRRLDQKGFSKLSSVDEFLEKMGVEKVVPEPKLVVKKENLQDVEMKVVVLEI
ncbi:lactamase [Candidatus Roizmanbacteria bacterium CG_4_10_14_0_8_um_filter_35_28]|uniref:Lactamase n=1 Tax=Candidatus Roizmanbacteria bacterium CG_4_10_14_0_8_um_filter_35_28 TaxID=1974827 RepID=A0A2M7QGU5_9BACT|nr:MAG: lactamase [Candidatus Roizmanbacteria bacterium CG_4_10_14_0_8_um_filter_35_28]